MERFKTYIGLDKLGYPSGYKSIFDRETGIHIREVGEDGLCPAPEIADIEISTICSRGCKFCYKDNKSKGENMSLETFKDVLRKFNLDILTQIAFGIGDINANPDIWKILAYTRSKGIIPNITVNPDITQSDANKLASLCGAVAVSYYGLAETLEAVCKLHDSGLKQVNIHALVSEETKSDVELLFERSKYVPELNAIVLLALKPKGRGVAFTPLKGFGWYKRNFEGAKKYNMGLGMDTCSACRFKAEVDDPSLDSIIETCESTLASIYIDVKGVAYPCSFSVGKIQGQNLLNERTDVSDIWRSDIFKAFRRELRLTRGKCPIYDI